MEGSSSYRRKLIRLVTFLGGVYFFFEFILPKPALEAIGIANFHTDISKGFRAFGTMAVGLGIINLLLVHGSKVVFLRKNSSYSIVLLLGLFSMMTVAALDWREGDQLTKKAAQFSHLADFGEVILRDYRSEIKNVRLDSSVNQQTQRFEIYEKTRERRDIFFKAVHDALAKLPDYIGDEPEDEKDREVFQSYVGKIQQSKYQTGKFLLAQRIITEGEEVDLSLVIATAKEFRVLRTELQKLLFLKQKYSVVKNLYNFLYQGLFVALGSAMFSLLAMYIAAAAYRAFRIKTLESALMMAAAIVVMLGQIPFYAYISGDLPFIRAWLLEVPNSAAFRAIKIGAAIAGLVMAFRMWFSIESESFSQGDKSS